MASTGFKTISQVAEILDRPEIDEKSRHFILELLTKTLGENIQLKTSLDEKQDLCERHIANQALGDHEIELLENTIKSLRDQLKEKEMMIRHDTKEIKKLRGELKEKEEDIESEEDSEEEDSEEEDSEEEDSGEEDSEEEEEPRRRYVAPTVDDPLVPVMENGEKKWYRRSECCGSYSWGGEELWVRNWM
jgi:chromosome segregation ATPase